ncbi:LCCL domain-containing protein [Streptomyces sp. NPDC058676]|uniref:LCCL domain-containing protein n=1 Tax=unclassified Streptomyces TaxID=2593676 RepID=UPI00364C6828
MTTPIQKEALGRLTLIDGGKGGQAKVLEAPHASVAGGLAVYKEYHPHILADLDVNQLHRMVGFPFRLSAKKRADLYRIAAWPAALVAEKGRVVGFVMPRVGDQFFCELTLPYNRENVLARYQLLLNKDRYLREVGIVICDADRIRLMHSAAVALKYLHAHRVTVGDFSPNNLLFDLSLHKSCFIDCDAMLLDGVGVLPQGETPDWDVGSVSAEPLGTTQSDIYKFGLLFLRIFAGDQMTRNPKELNGHFSADVFETLQSSLSPVASRRPSIDEWIEVIQRCQNQQQTAKHRPRQQAPSVTTQKKAAIVRPPAARPAQTSHRSPVRKPTLIALAIIFVVLGVISAVLVAVFGGESEEEGGQTRPSSKAPSSASHVSPTPSSESPSPEATDQIISWSTTAQNLEAPVGKRLTVACPGSGELGTVYGTDLYTDDSSICTAAVHAGGISIGEGGKVTIIIRDGAAKYIGSERNGVTSEDWAQPWDRSFEVLTGRAPSRSGNTQISWSETASAYSDQVGKRLVFECLPGGEAASIWGTGKYTDDSSICTAGVHAGKISLKNGGSVAVVIAGASSSFKGSTRNGVTSSDYAEWPHSFIVVD